VVDAGATTIIPGLVDGHSHLTLPGGSHWIERGADPTETLVAVAESNGELQHRSGVRWARDVGSPRRPCGGGEQAVGVRDRWRGRRDRPYVRAAGTWITVAGLLPAAAITDRGFGLAHRGRRWAGSPSLRSRVRPRWLSTGADPRTAMPSGGPRHRP
jgi:hypothetical protein